MKLHTILTKSAFVSSFVFGILALNQGVAFAQTFQSGSSTSSSAIASPACFVISDNLSYGATDASTMSSVTSLQSFLAAQDYFNSAAIGTGTFGPLTLQAVKEFQAAHGLPDTGYVGPLTRAVITQINNERCGTPVPTPVTPEPTPTQTGTTVIDSISPDAEPVGATVTITGSGFTDDNTILFNGNVAARDVEPTLVNAETQAITFTVPSSLSPDCYPDSACPMYMLLASPGQYNVTLANTNGTSNSLVFTIASGGSIVPSSQPLTISGLDAPSSLGVGQTGTWDVHVLTNNYSGNLHYSVVWGDESEEPIANDMSAAGTVSNSSTFTHAYENPGTYTPVFTVTDDSGASVSTSNTLTVSQIYY